jgi:hypothetical protein
MTYYKVEVSADSSGTFATNGLLFETKAEAETYALDLSCRWTAVRETRIRRATKQEISSGMRSGPYGPKSETESERKSRQA